MYNNYDDYVNLLLRHIILSKVIYIWNKKKQLITETNSLAIWFIRSAFKHIYENKSVPKPISYNNFWPIIYVYTRNFF